LHKLKADVAVLERKNSSLVEELEEIQKERDQVVGFWYENRFAS